MAGNAIGDGFGEWKCYGTWKAILVWVNPLRFFHVQVRLCEQLDDKPCQIWHLIPVASESETAPHGKGTTRASKASTIEPPVRTTADTVIDAEGLRIDGNGELAITTTTTTTTTTVTKVKRVNCS